MLARIFANNAIFACASDPMRPFFNAYRSKIFEVYRLGEVDLADPLDDYYKTNSSYLKILSTLKFNEVLDVKELKEVRQLVFRASEPYSPKFSTYIESIKDETSGVLSWGDEIDLYIDAIYKIYKTNKARAVAFKEVWATEMSFPLLNRYDNAKVLSIIRDPRAIFASSKNNAGNYPILFLARQWRKHLYLSYLLKKIYPERVAIVHYEDLATGDARAILNERLSKLFGSEYSFEEGELTMVNDHGEKWTKNSSHNGINNISTVDSGTINAWKDVLTKSEVEWIEYLTQNTMLGDMYGGKNCSLPVSLYPKRNASAVALWMRDLLNRYEGDKLESCLVDEIGRVSLLDSHSNLSFNSINEHV